MFNKFRQRVKNLFGATGSMGGFGILGWDSLSRKAYNWLNWFNRSPRLKPLDKIASDISKTKLVHVDRNGSPLKNSPALEMLANPNHLPEFTQFNLFWLTAIWYDLLGEAFWMIVDKEILPIPPTWVKAIPRTMNERCYKVQTSDGAIYDVEKEMMIYFKRPNVAEPYKRGAGNAAQVGDELQTDEYMAKHQALTFKNNGMPPMVISLQDSNKEQRDRFKADWYNQYGGLSNSQKIGVIDGGRINIQVLQQTMKDLDFIDSRKFTQDQVLQHYMIPPELMGKVTNSNRATITQAQKIYEENALEPRLIAIEDVLNKQFMVYMGFKGKLCYVDYVTQDKEFTYDDADKGWDSGMYTRNEALMMKGLEPVPGGDVYKVTSLGTTFIPSGKAIQGAKQVPDDFSLEFEITNPEKEAKEKLWKAVDDAAISQEEDATSSLQRFFRDQGKRIQAAVTEASKKLDDYDDIKIDWADENAKLLDTLNPIWWTSAKAGMQVVDEAFDFGLSWDVVRDEWFAAVEDFGLERADFVNETTKKKLKKSIKQGIKEGESISQIAERIDQIVKQNEEVRAVTIARTETHTATVGGTFYSYEAAGVTRKEWIATVDGRERQWHGTEMDGQVKDINEAFISGLGNELMYPGDPSASAEEVINCRCAIAPVIF